MTYLGEGIFVRNLLIGGVVALMAKRHRFNQVPVELRGDGPGSHIMLSKCKNDSGKATNLLIIIARGFRSRNSLEPEFGDTRLRSPLVSE